MSVLPLSQYLINSPFTPSFMRLAESMCRLSVISTFHRITPQLAQVVKLSRVHPRVTDYRAFQSDKTELIFRTRG